jgi:adenosylcobinamide-phosphate synthase
MLLPTFACHVLAACGGVILDALLGEARRWHPLVGFGRWAQWLEQSLNKNAKPLGLLAWVLAVLPLVLAAWGLLYLAQSISIWLALGLHAVLLYFCLGLRSLHEHASPIQAALQAGDVAQARLLTARIVSRDTAQAGEEDLSKAAVESMLENGCDAVFGALFWFALAGGPGALLYRLANTLDAMWGYRNPRFLYFGWAAARIDDVLNYVPARLTAISYTLLGHSATAWRCWRTQAPAWSSPNAGPVMAAGAGALQLALGGLARYDGEWEQRPPLGVGRPATAADITRAWRLVLYTCLLWLALMLASLPLLRIVHA